MHTDVLHIQGYSVAVKNYLLSGLVFAGKGLEQMASHDERFKSYNLNNTVHLI